MSAKAYQIATAATAIASSVYAASLSGLSFERYWWHGVGLSFGIWSVLESRQSIKEQVEDDTLEDADQQIFLGKVSNRVKLETMPPAPLTQALPSQQYQLTSPGHDEPVIDRTSTAPNITPSNFLDQLVADKKSTILSAIPGTTKTTLVLAWLQRLYQLYSQAEVYVACAKNDSFLGLNQIPNRVKVCQSPEDFVEQLEQVANALKIRTNTPEDQRDFDNYPLRFLFDDGTYLLGNIKKRSKELFTRCKDLLCFIGTVGREFNVGYFGSVHSLNLDQLGLEAKDIRDCLNVCSLGFISKDSRGNTAGGYDSLTSVIGRNEIVSKQDRPDLINQLQQLISQSKQESRPILFTTLGIEPSLQLLDDLRPLTQQNIARFDNAQGELKSINSVEQDVEELIAYTDPVEPQSGQSDLQKRILENLVKVEIVQPDKDYVPEELLKIIDFSKQKGWVSASQVKAGKKGLRNYTTSEIRRMFSDLLNRGFGAIRGEGETIEWSIHPSD
ncbi:MAG: hypothetical protein AAFO04_27490 [Cyanobacteria bacterium J06592_8]